MSIGQIREDLKKLAKLAANVSDAHTCVIFLPTGLLTSGSPLKTLETPPPPHIPSSILANNDTIELKKIFQLGPELTIGSIEMVAVQSLSTSVVRDCRIQVGNGLLGWVSENSRSIHVAPFDMDSSVLGIYSETETLKSLAAVPIPMPAENPNDRNFSGVLMCDSKKAFSFTKLQIKHLEDIATLISRLLYWTVFKKRRPQPSRRGIASSRRPPNWETLSDRTLSSSSAFIRKPSLNLRRPTVSPSRSSTASNSFGSFNRRSRRTSRWCACQTGTS